MFKTEQEKFWAEQFGDEYIDRNSNDEVAAANLSFWSRILSKIDSVDSCVELGSNIGNNIRAIRALSPGAYLEAIEINERAVKELANWFSKAGGGSVQHASIIDWKPVEKFDLAFTKGVLIHISPDHLQTVYENLFQSSKKYIVVAEYYNPVPVSVSYRGHSEKLFKRDFAGEMLDLYPSLQLVDYGFVYHRDPAFPADYISWFILEKKPA